MKTISVLISDAQYEMLDRIIEGGFAIDKVDAIQKGIILLAREEAIKSISRSKKDIKEGKVFRGDLDELVKLFD